MGMEGLDTTELLAENAAAIAAVGSKTGLGGGNEGPYDDLWLLRYVLAAKGDADAAATEVEATLSWRRGEGKAIVDAAASGLEAARAGGGWDNGALFSAAPHSAAIAPTSRPTAPDSDAACEAGVPRESDTRLGHRRQGPHEHGYH